MPLPSPTAAIERLDRQAGRVREIMQVLVKYQLAGWLSAIPVPRILEFMDHSEGPQIKDLSRDERIRLALTDLGTTFIKVGQMMSTRADLVGTDLAKELSKLQSQTIADSPEIVRATIEEELGKKPEEIFAQFEEVAFASASIAQVHRAELPTGEVVALKVQKSGIRRRIEADLSILASIADLVERHSPELKPYEPIKLVAEFRRTLLNELDFTREARNLESFCHNFTDDATVHFPRPYQEFSSRRVLTMEFMEGTLGSDVTELREAGEDLSEFARRGATIYLEMIFRDSFYHADPHPGNLMLLPNQVVGILDCGMVARLDEDLHEDFENLILAVSQGDSEILADTLWKLSTGQPAYGRDQLRSELSELMADSTQATLSEINLSDTINKLAALIRKYKISLQPGLSTLLKTLVLLEGAAQLLNPRFSLAEVMEPYYEKIMIQRLSPQRLGRRLQRSYRDWDRLAQTLPRDLNQTLQEVQAGKFRVKLELQRLDAVVNRLVLGIIVAALLLGSSLLWSMKAPPLYDNVSIFGVAGYLMAFVLGLLLFRGIEKSRRISRKD